MAKFNVVDNRTIVATGPIAVQSTAKTLKTFEGEPAYARNAKSDLFLLGVANMVSEQTFYEDGKVRDARFAALVQQVAVQDVAWLTGFVGWLRRTANMRSAPLVAAAEGVRARLASGLTGGNRQLVDAALNRADEPAEFLAYWRSRFGKALPAPVKKGLADAAVRLYNERSALKYDTGEGYRMADVIELTHAKPKAAWQSALFEHLLARRHNRPEQLRNAELLPMITTRKAFMEIDPSTRRMLLDSADFPEMLAKAGLTWEALSAWLNGPMDAKAWEAVIPSMGLMALARNLRNFDEAGVSDEAAAAVVARFSDPEQIARSRMLPFRWLSAFEHAPSLRWGHGLSKALEASLTNIPSFGGRTLVLVDTSASMSSVGFSRKSKVTPVKAASIFGVSLALKGEKVDLVGFADGTFVHTPQRGASLLTEVDRFIRRVGEVGHGTEIARSLRKHFAGHDRVVLISDMQTMGGYYAHGVSESIPANVPLYGFNLEGYAPTVIPASAQTKRYEFGGLTDATFQMIPLIESGTSQGFPWEN